MKPAVVDDSAPWVLGYSASHNGAACLLKGDTVFVAIQEERLTGEKRARITRPDQSLAIKYCLAAAGIGAVDLAAVVGAHFSGASVDGATFWPAGWRGLFEVIPHHYAHAVGAFATSGFADAAVLVIDGQGGFEDSLPETERVNIRRATAPGISRYSEIVSIYRAQGRTIHCVEKHVGDWIPHMDRLTAQHGMQGFGSLGGMYAAAAHVIFGDAMDSGKVMGLASLGAPAYPVSDFFTIGPDGALAFFDNVIADFAAPVRWPERRDAYSGLAASVQAAIEAGVLAFAERARRLTNSPRLCYTGGVALNAVANELLIRRKIFDDVFLQPAAEDSGTAIGAAYHGLWRLLDMRGAPRRPLAPTVHDSAGRRYPQQEVEAAIAATPGIEVIARDSIIERTASLLVEGAVVGWFDGGSELGPRALGHRSLLCDPRPSDAKEKMNLKVKHREAFRPFAPIIVESKTAEWFDAPAHAPFSPVMLRVFPFQREMAPRVPAVVHYDGTGRLQSLRQSTHPRLFALVDAFDRLTGTPIILNTSFNVMGEPIIETPEDALWSLLYTAIDYCVFDGAIVRRSPTFASMLDLRPSLNVASVISETRFEADPASGQQRRQVVQFAEAKTPWGVYKTSLHPIVFAVLSRTDGRATGRDILASLRAQTGLDEKSMTALMHALRRRYLVTLR